jgi:hypothetical protein
VIRIIHNENIKNKLHQRGLQFNEALNLDNFYTMQHSPTNLLGSATLLMPMRTSNGSK